MLTHARLFLKTHPRSSGQDVLEMLEDGCDRFWVPGTQIDSKTTIAGVPIIKVRDALRRSDACFTPRSSLNGSSSPGKGRGRPERLTIDGRVVLSPDIDGNERYELATAGHALAGATAQQPVTRDTACWASCRPTTRTAFRLRPAALLICSACDPICSACDRDRRADGCTTEPQGAAAFAGASCDGPTRGVEPGMNKRDLSEADICAKFITPHVEKAGWDDATQIRREVHFTKGQIHVRGKMVTRGKSKFADYVLYSKPNIPIAIIEAKENNHAVGDGMQQALEYAEVLNIPFVFSSNGDGFVFHDRTGTLPAVETTLPLGGFPSPARLWAIYRGWKGLSADQEHVVLQDYFDDGSERQPRYYQRNAINAATEAIAKGQNRLLLVMATGTGKTYTAFQIIWRLWKADRKKRVLYLADRNILIDQTMVNDFRPFGPAMAKLNPAPRTIESADGTTNQIASALDRQRRIDPSYEIYLGLYQAITGPEERQKLFREFSPGFFDLIVIDECHRGSAADDAAWREILDYFSSATQIGMTATPKETKYVSNIHYFGAPVYTYSLKQGIQDGFLAPYKVINVHIDVDVDGYRPRQGATDVDGELIPDHIYNQKDFDRTLVIDDRTKLVAKRVTEFLKETDQRFQKTILFCVDQEHAARMRQALVNENGDLFAANRRYVMRITGADKEGQDQLGNFIDPESTYPVLVTTSRLLSTGVDAQTCRLIVLDRPVGSMTEFKQILGRGTRIHEDTNKLYFTLMDFRGATSHL